MRPYDFPQRDRDKFTGSGECGRHHNIESESDSEPKKESFWKKISPYAFALVACGVTYFATKNNTGSEIDKVRTDLRDSIITITQRYDSSLQRQINDLSSISGINSNYTDSLKDKIDRTSRRVDGLVSRVSKDSTELEDFKSFTIDQDGLLQEQIDANNYSVGVRIDAFENNTKKSFSDLREYVNKRTGLFGEVEDSLTNTMVQDIDPVIRKYNQQFVLYDFPLGNGFGHTNGNGWGLSTFDDTKTVKAAVSSDNTLQERLHNLAVDLVNQRRNPQETDSILSEIKYNLVVNRMKVEERFKWRKTHFEDASSSGYLDSLRAWMKTNRR
jgi:hypothetical protein